MVGPRGGHRPAYIAGCAGPWIRSSGLTRCGRQQGDLEPEDEALFRRCDALVKRLKGTARRTGAARRRVTMM